jgi:hypothetical protein
MASATDQVCSSPQAEHLSSVGCTGNSLKVWMLTIMPVEISRPVFGQRITIMKCIVHTGAETIGARKSIEHAAKRHENSALRARPSRGAIERWMRSGEGRTRILEIGLANSGCSK